MGCSEHGCANTGLSPCSEPYAQRLLDHAVTNCPPISVLYIFIIFKKGKYPENLGTPPPSQDTGPHYWLCFLLYLVLVASAFWCHMFVGEGWSCFNLTLSCNRLFPSPSFSSHFLLLKFGSRLAALVACMGISTSCGLLRGIPLPHPHTPHSQGLLMQAASLHNADVAGLTSGVFYQPLGGLMYSSLDSLISRP